MEHSVVGTMNTEGENVNVSKKVAIEVTHFINPYVMRVYEIEGHARATTVLEKKLHQLIHGCKLQGYGNATPRLGDCVIVQNRLKFNANIPGWQCRGAIASIDRTNSTYGVLLQDHGIVVNLFKEDLKILPEGLIDDEYLTFNVAIANVLPVDFVDSNLCVVDQWTPSASQFARELISASYKTYFEEFTDYASGHKIGEIYVVLKDEVVVLSESLVLNGYAKYVNEDPTEPMIQPTDRGQSDDISKTVNESTDSSQGKEEWIVHASPDGYQRSRSSGVYLRAFGKDNMSQLLGEAQGEMFVHGPADCQPLEVITEARFSPSIHRVLTSLKFVKPTRVQSYLWPAIMRALDVVAISPPKSGKMFAYVAPICASILNKDTYSTRRASIKPSGKPSALIVCSSSTDVAHIQSACRELMLEHPQVKILGAYNGMAERSLMAQVYNGCEILISTPSLLCRLLKIHQLLDFRQLRHLVFDAADVILEKYEQPLVKILDAQTRAQMTTKRQPGNAKLQTVVIGRQWTRKLKNFVAAKIPEAQIFIGSYFEGAVYAGLRPKFIILRRDQKLAKVVELLADKTAVMLKTIIICDTSDEVIELDNTLRSKSVATLLAHDDMIFYKIRGVAEAWKATISGQYPVLICTDGVLSELNVRDADRLIHYSIPIRSKSQFNYRFSALSNNFHQRKVRNKENIQYPSIVMMIDETNEVQLNGVWNAALRLGAKFNPEMKEYLEKIFISLEEKRSNQPLCDNIKTSGYCLESGSCSWRHRIVPSAENPSTNLKIGDSVKIVIAFVHAANHFSARIVEYTEARTGKKKAFSLPEFLNLSVMMQRLFADPRNRRPAKEVNVGDILAAEGGTDEYKRVRVLKIMESSRPNNRTAILRCIDDGNQMSRKTSHLMELPEQLAAWPSHIVDVYLTGIVPLDDEPTWSPCANEVAYEWVGKNLSPTSYFYGKVALHLGSDLWVDPLELRYDMIMKGFEDCCIESSLKTILIEKGCGVANKKPIERLLALCKTSGMTVDQSSEDDDNSVEQVDH